MRPVMVMKSSSHPVSTTSSVSNSTARRSHFVVPPDPMDYPPPPSRPTADGKSGSLPSASTSGIILSPEEYEKGLLMRAARTKHHLRRVMKLIEPIPQ